MKDYKPYQNWTRKKMYENIVDSCIKTGNDDLIAHYGNIVFDPRWNPIEDYNGCNLIQDRLHIFPPCFEHDFYWFVLGGGIEYDRKFRDRCIQFGSSKFEAKRNFIGVRIGWIFYNKWDKMYKRYKNK